MLVWELGYFVKLCKQMDPSCLHNILYIDFKHDSNGNWMAMYSWNPSLFDCIYQLGIFLQHPSWELWCKNCCHCHRHPNTPNIAAINSTTDINAVSTTTTGTAIPLLLPLLPYPCYCYPPVPSVLLQSLLPLYLNTPASATNSTTTVTGNATTTQKPSPLPSPLYILPLSPSYPCDDVWWELTQYILVTILASS